ncbi:hypothetical protein ACO0RG_000018 [Hanseniaspora osmophila]
MDLSKILDAAPQLNIVDDDVKHNKTEDTSGDYWLPTPLSTEQSVIYDQIISLHYSDILKYFSGDSVGIDKQASVQNEAHFPEDVIKHSLDTMLFNLETILLHPYLLLTHNLPRSLTTKDTPNSLCTQSGKCKVLRDLVNLVSKYETNTAIVCRGDVSLNDWSFGQRSVAASKKDGPTSDSNATFESSTNSNNSANNYKMVDMLEALLLGSKVNIKRYDGRKFIKKSNSGGSTNSKESLNSHDSEPAEEKETGSTGASKSNNSGGRPCTVHIFSSSNLDEVHKKLDKSIYFDLMICIDSSVPANVSTKLNKYPGIKKILTMNREFPAPIIRVASINGMDHAALYFQSKWPNFETKNLAVRDNKVLKNVVATSVVLRNQAGILPPALKPVYETNLEFLSDWIASPDLAWPLPKLYAIPEFKRFDVERSLLTKFNNFNPNKAQSPLADLKCKSINSSKADEGTLPYLQNDISEKMYRAINPSADDAFYQAKRCQNEYRSNPLLRKNMSTLTGISTTDEKYFLDNAFVTHELIYALSSTYRYLQLEKSELDSYTLYDPQIELQTKSLTEMFEELNSKVAHAEKQIKNDNVTVSRFLRVQDNTRSQIEKFGKQNIPKLILLKKELEKMKKSFELKCTEKEYMSAEIAKASKTIDENNHQITAMKAEIKNTNLHINSKIELDKETSIKLKEECGKLKQKIAVFKNGKTQIENEMTSLNKIVKEMPVKRSIRSQTVRRRHRK